MKFKEFSGYILAGGKSSRMGRDKAFLKIGEQTFLQNADDILKPICEDRIKIVLNNSQANFSKKLPNQIPTIFDKYENRGALGGIHASLKDCQTKFAIILAVDLPFVTSGVIEKLAEFSIESEEFSAVIPKQNNDKLQPLCGIYRVGKCLPKIEHLLESEESNSVMFSLTKLPKIKTIPESQFKTKNIFLNINTAPEYKKLKDKM